MNKIASCIATIGKVARMAKRSGISFLVHNLKTPTRCLDLKCYRKVRFKSEHSNAYYGKLTYVHSAKVEEKFFLLLATDALLHNYACKYSKKAIN